MTETPTHPLIGKPLAFYAKGKRRVIGRIVDVEIVGSDLQFTGTITDAFVADLLGLPADEELKGVLPDGQP
jgi:hypothetical protein